MGVEIKLLLIFALLIFWLIWRKIRPSLQHIADEDLQDFLENRVQGQPLKVIREHLLYCDECKDRLDELQKDGHKPKPERLLKRRF